MLSNVATTTPTVCPLESSWLMRHARIDQYADLDLVGIYGVVATDLVENFLSRYLLTRTVSWTFTDSPSTKNMPDMHVVPSWQWSIYMRRLPVLELPRPASSVTSVTLGLWDQPDMLLVEDTDYQLDLTTTRGRLRWLSSAYLDPSRDHLEIVFVSGYGADHTHIPAPILHAITILTTNLYENRGDRGFEVWTMAVESLLAPYRVCFFGN